MLLARKQATARQVSVLIQSTLHILIDGPLTMIRQSVFKRWSALLLLSLCCAACATVTESATLHKSTLDSPRDASAARCGTGPIDFTGRLFYTFHTTLETAVHQLSCASDGTLQDTVVARGSKVAYSPDHHFVAYGTGDQYFLYNVLTGESRPLPFPDGVVPECISWSPDNTRFTYKHDHYPDTTGADSDLYLYDLNTGQSAKVYTAPSAQFSLTDIDPLHATGKTYFGRSSCVVSWLDRDHFLFDRFTGLLPSHISVPLGGGGAG
jgi:hypothetical protein